MDILLPPDSMLDSITKDKYSSQSRRFGLIEIPSTTEGQAVISALKGKVLKDRTLEVSEARPRSEDRRGGGRRGGGRRSY